MNYYRVAVASNQYHGAEPLTYQSEEVLRVGHVVVVSLRRKNVIGIVLDTTTKPTYATKPILRVVTPSPIPVAQTALLRWLGEYYPSSSGLTTQLFLAPALTRETYRPKPKKISKLVPVKLPSLTDEQAGVVKAISASKATSYLLHGDTGTGKTRVYQELAAQALAHQKSVLIMTPEIGLTPQLAHAFQSAFSEQVIITHSNLTDTERRSLWLELVGATEPYIVIGPRSALFTPIQNLGLIIMDEAHETSYKQESAPYYQTTRVASKLAALQNAKFVMGTATPPVAEYYLAEAKKVPILRMTSRPVQASTSLQSAVEVIDLKDRTSFTRQTHLSNQLLNKIAENLKNKSQVLVFLNRRGTARLVLCSDCSWQALCPRCDIPLTYHADTHSVRCHTCGYYDSAPTACPSCGGVNILFKSIGTKAIVEELSKEFPKARIKRFDTDNAKTERLEEQFADVLAGNVDILVGTQMLAKGLDLPNLGLVGVVAADTSLYFPDYSAEERTYQLLCQVVGRVGRGHKTGHAIIQTYHPDSAALQAVIDQNWDIFYSQQINERKTFRFPPFCFILKLTCERATQKSAAEASEKLLKILRSQGKQVEVIGPSPSFQEKVRGKYRWQLVVKSKNRSELLSLIAVIPSGWTYDLDPNHLL